ncbi:Uncharacterized conserved protein [Nakamurella panacisegetis]|uniref:Uncharacterized conserved protein n=1 Tax=Nakamurella panacisegetis TaxID=1090615 RepID=A0A1H0LTA3_9ACTN|nr:YciI family protein [Nakamurella panacisegetis]SDO71364.1 Uncharacterized conserved protein [Nakamurella panacisegetis]
MAKYLILIYGNEQRWESMTPDQMQRLDAGHRAFHRAADGAVLTGAALEPTTTATSLRAGESPENPTITDGPFLETKEAVGGFYLLEAPDLDAAIALARLLPEVGDDHSGVEVRPLQGPS